MLHVTKPSASVAMYNALFVAITTFGFLCRGHGVASNYLISYAVVAITNHLAIRVISFVLCC